MSKKDDAVTPKEPKSLDIPEKLVAAVPKEAFKAMFYMFAGRPDSKTKIFGRKVLIDIDAVYQLQEQVTDKLRLHSIDQIVTTATLKFKKKEIVQFGTWAEFESYDWRTADISNELSVRFDFLLKTDEFATPQRHTLTVKITTAPNPRDFFQFIMSHDPEDDDVEGRLGLCVVRVDFISHRLADELIDVVARWNKSLKQPSSEKGVFGKLEKFDKILARLVHISIPILATILALAILKNSMPDEAKPINSTCFYNGLQWLLLSGISLYILIRFSKYLANHCFMAVNEYGSFTPFKLTSGDENEAQRLKGQDGKRVLQFCFSSGFAIFLNIVAGIATWWLLK